MTFSLLTETHLVKYTEDKDGLQQLWVYSCNPRKEQTVILQYLWRQTLFLPVPTESWKRSLIYKNRKISVPTLG